ncbi:MAG: SET domain-containing protein [Alphaproteobacteria bacterium]|nr:SET domain-containing protein [Alphaproteobacteria bacterium]
MRIKEGPHGLGLEATGPLSQGTVIFDGCPVPGTVGIMTIGGPEAARDLEEMPDLKSHLLQVGRDCWWGGPVHETAYRLARLDRLLSSRPEDPVALVSKCWTLAEVNTNGWRHLAPPDGAGDAQDIAARLLSVAGDHADTHRVLAYLDLSNGGTAAALDRVDRALGIDRSTDTLCDKVFLLTLVGRFRDAYALAAALAGRATTPLRSLALGLLSLFSDSPSNAAIHLEASLEQLRDAPEATDGLPEAFDHPWETWGYTSRVSPCASGRRGRCGTTFLPHWRLHVIGRFLLAAALFRQDRADLAARHLADAEIMGPGSLCIAMVRKWLDVSGLPEIDLLCRDLESLGVPETRPVEPQYLNHSCDPNVVFDAEFTFRTLRNVRRGEELTFDYTTTDEEIIAFDCVCGADQCLGIVRGARHLSPDALDRRRPLLSPYIGSLMGASHNCRSDG